MNAQQIKTAQKVTGKKWLDWNVKCYIAGEMSFSAEQIGDVFFIHGSNTETTEWFEKQVIVQFLIGPRGGIQKFTVIQ